VRYIPSRAASRGAAADRPPQGRSPQGTQPMPLCVYLCYTPGCNTKMDRWMPTAQEGEAARFECPRCGVVMQCAWTGSQMKTPNLKDVAEFKPRG